MSAPSVANRELSVYQIPDIFLVVGVRWVPAVGYASLQCSKSAEEERMADSDYLSG